MLYIFQENTLYTKIIDCQHFIIMNSLPRKKWAKSFKKPCSRNLGRNLQSENLEKDIREGHRRDPKRIRTRFRVTQITS